MGVLKKYPKTKRVVVDRVLDGMKNPVQPSNMRARRKKRGRGSKGSSSEKSQQTPGVGLVTARWVSLVGEEYPEEGRILNEVRLHFWISIFVVFSGYETQVED